MRCLSWLAAVAVGLGSAGCDDVGPGREVRVRVENGSALTFDRIVLYPGGSDSVVATSLGPNRRTGYQVVPVAYSIATVEAWFGAESDRMQVIDHLGDPSLEVGDYTYLIGVEVTGGRKQLTQTLRRD